MSMLSMLIDRLRSHADLYDGTKEPPLEPKLQRPWLARELREAADTIWQLRDDLQQANAENAKLRDSLEFANNECEKVSLEYLNLQAENAKLRELAERAWKAAEMLCQAWDGPCRADGVSTMKPCPMMERDELCVYGLIQCDLREMGIEADA